MRKRFSCLLILVLTIAFKTTIAKVNKHVFYTNIHYNKDETNFSRSKRSLNEILNENYNRDQSATNQNLYSEYLSNLSNKIESKQSSDRARLYSFSDQYPPIVKDLNNANNMCKTCFKSLKWLNSLSKIRNSRDRENVPFWGNRRRRASDDYPKDNWQNKDDLNDPFWGSRGRRQDEEPFWGSIGRLDASAVNRRLRDDVEEPFWGSRGRRKDEEEPFWGSRGRRDDIDIPFWGSRGRRESNSFSEGSVLPDGKRTQQDAKNSFLKAIEAVEKNLIIDLIRVALTDPEINLGSNNNIGRIRKMLTNPLSKVKPASRFSNSEIFAEQPHYIIVERSGRSSGEDDPFFISRGKKRFVDYEFAEAARDRRGVIEELVKSVRNDPYYLARGKKDIDVVKIGNNTLLRKEFIRAKELICSVVDLIALKKEGHKVKRETEENDRDRRTILKKLAAQLQMDPYFVSRGKKNKEIFINDLNDFIETVRGKC